MNDTITAEILVACSQCPRKAYLLLFTNEKGKPHEYALILEQKKRANQIKYINLLKQKNPDVQPYNIDNLKSGSDFLINATLRVKDLEARCGILIKLEGGSSLGSQNYEPAIFVGTHSINKEQKLELFFTGYVLERIQNKRPVSGRIIGMDEKSHKVKLENSNKTLVPLLEPLQEWTTNSPLEPPPVILNKHCSYCQFHALCKAKAEEEDNLSLLDGISTSKAIAKYEKRGIFTVKQLSYLFKPGKRKKWANNPPAMHKPELQALGIREGKIYIQELPELSRQALELFLDIEGIPDQQVYYLIGLLVCEADTCNTILFGQQHSKMKPRFGKNFSKRSINTLTH